MLSALRKTYLLHHVGLRHVTFCDSQVIQQEEDTHKAREMFKKFDDRQKKLLIEFFMDF